MKRSIKRKIAVSFLERITRLEFFNVVKRPNTLTVLNYHRIFTPPDGFLYDEGVVSTSVEDFEKQICFVKKYFSVINFNDLMLINEGKMKCPVRPLIITFDDGYYDNYKYAYPILRRHGLPGMFFLAVDYIGTNKLFWWDETAYAVKTVQRNDLNAIFEKFCVEMIPPDQSAYKTIHNILKTIKKMPDDQRVSFIEEMKKQSIFKGDKDRQIMNWEEVVEMSQNGMEIGSHSMSHPVLSKVQQEDALNWEIEESKRVLEERLGKSVLVFSYPVGGADSYNDKTTSIIKRAGYRFALTYQNGVEAIGKINYFTMKRMHIDGLNIKEFRLKMMLPWIF